MKLLGLFINVFQIILRLQLDIIILQRTQCVDKITCVTVIDILRKTPKTDKM